MLPNAQIVGMLVDFESGEAHGDPSHVCVGPSKRGEPSDPFTYLSGLSGFGEQFWYGKDRPNELLGWYLDSEDLKIFSRQFCGTAFTIEDVGELISHFVVLVLVILTLILWQTFVSQLTTQAPQNSPCVASGYKLQTLAIGSPIMNWLRNDTRLNVTKSMR
tara:strand:+ start:8279 stop:8761 length:483 start_codon:yes stop_codon:yes gene_type:complete